MQNSERRRWWALGALAIVLVTIGLDVTILNVALPTLAVELDATTSQLQWFASAYTLVLAATLLPAGLFGDRFGQKRLLLGALALFGVASIGCAYAGSAEVLIAARAVLGFAAAFMIPLSMSLLTMLFPAAERGKAIAVWSTAMAVGIPIGPVLGGWLLNNFWWGSIFLINVPLIVLGVTALAVLLPSTTGSREQRFDVAGILFSSTGLAVLTYGLIEAGEAGWTAPEALLPIIGGVAVLAVFGLWQRRADQPLVRLDLFASPGFTWGTVLAALATFAMLGTVFVLPQYFQAVFSTDSLGTGLRLLPLVGGFLVGVQLAQRLLDKLGGKLVVATGFLLITSGLATGATTDVADAYGFAAVWLSLIGVGLGFAMPPAMDIAMGALREGSTGVGSGLLQAMRQTGGTLGVAILGTVLGSGYGAMVAVTRLPDPAADAVTDTPAAGVRVAQTLGSPQLLQSVRAAFVHGMSNALWVCACVSALGVLLALAFLPRRPEDQRQSDDELVAR